MNCILCEKSIGNYDANFNHLVIDQNRSVEICRECIDKFGKWQGSKIALLFPTKALKKRFGGKK